MALTRIEVKEAARSTYERPLWQWRVYVQTRLVALGYCPTHAEAEAQARRSAEAAKLRPEYFPGRRVGSW